MSKVVIGIRLDVDAIGDWMQRITNYLYGTEELMLNKVTVVN